MAQRDPGGLGLPPAVAHLVEVEAVVGGGDLGVAHVVALSRLNFGKPRVTGPPEAPAASCVSRATTPAN
jgi:hypothetical protein